MIHNTNSNIHPYESNSRIYNFFFHPLHEKGTTKFFSAITTLFLTVVTGCIWLIPFATINILDNRKLKVWKANHLSKTNKVSSMVFQKDEIKNTNSLNIIALPKQKSPSIFQELADVSDTIIEAKDGHSQKLEISKLQNSSSQLLSTPITTPNPGGFQRNGKSCFVASSLQIMRQIPAVRLKTNSDINSLTQKNDETEYEFECRKEIQKSIHQLLCLTDNGETASIDQLDNLRNLYFKWKQLPVNEMGDPYDILMTLEPLFNFTCVSPCFINHQGMGAPNTRNSPPYDALQELKNSLSNQDLVCIQVITNASDNESFFWENHPELSLTNEQDVASYSYKLAGVITCDHSHAIAYVKSEKDWLEFNDATVRRVDRVPPVDECYIVYYKA